MNDQAYKLRVLAQAAPVRVAGVPRVAPCVVPVSAVSVARHGPSTPDTARTIAVTSGKGGVGKTNIALNISIALAGLNKKVVLLDADLGLANVHILLGIAPKSDLSSVVSGTATLAQVTLDGPAGIKIIPGASGLQSMANMDAIKLGSLQRTLSELETMYDFIIVDTGAGIGLTTTEFAAHADSVLLIMTPEPTSLADAYAMVKVLHEKGKPKFNVLVNMATTDGEGKEVFYRLNALTVKFLHQPIRLLGIVPLDAEVPRFVKAQKSMMVDRPTRLFATRISQCAMELAGMSIVKKNIGFFQRIFTSLHNNEI